MFYFAVLQVLTGANDSRVFTFLNSIRRGSENSRKSYQTSLIHFAEFLKSSNNKNQTPDTVIPQLSRGKISVYELLDQFVTYLTNKKEVAPLSLKVYVSAVKSYLEFNDIDIVPSKFRRRVKVPKYFPDQEEPLALADIRHLLEFNNNHRLRTFILLLVSSGMRAMEGASLRLQDVDFTTTNPTRITIRREFSKTKRARIIYCSDEATTHIKKLIEMHQSKRPEDFIFAIKKHTRLPESIYEKLLQQFQKLQHIAERDTKKENSRRRKTTLHSFRRTCFSIINENTNSQFADWFIGHHHSVYWTHKEQERREIYRTKCMPFLTIYQDSRNSTIEETLKMKDKAIETLQSQQNGLRERIDQLEAWLRDPEQFIKMRDDAYAMGKKKK